MQISACYASEQSSCLCDASRVRGSGASSASWACPPLCRAACPSVHPCAAPATVQAVDLAQLDSTSCLCSATRACSAGSAASMASSERALNCASGDVLSASPRARCGARLAHAEPASCNCFWHASVCSCLCLPPDACAVGGPAFPAHSEGAFPSASEAMFKFASSAPCAAPCVFVQEPLSVPLLGMLHFLVRMVARASPWLPCPLPRLWVLPLSFVAYWLPRLCATSRWAHRGVRSPRPLTGTLVCPYWGCCSAHIGGPACTCRSPCSGVCASAGPAAPCGVHS